MQDSIKEKESIIDTVSKKLGDNVMQMFQLKVTIDNLTVENRDLKKKMEKLSHKETPKGHPKSTPTGGHH